MKNHKFPDENTPLHFNVKVCIEKKLKRNNYPDDRKPAKSVRCPICGKLQAARGIKTHMRFHNNKEMPILEIEVKEGQLPGLLKIESSERFIIGPRISSITQVDPVGVNYFYYYNSELFYSELDCGTIAAAAAYFVITKKNLSKFFANEHLKDLIHLGKGKNYIRVSGSYDLFSLEVSTNFLPADIEIVNSEELTGWRFSILIRANKEAFQLFKSNMGIE